MPASSDNVVTRLLNAVGQGDEAAREELWLMLNDELHRVAQRQMAGQAPGHTLQTTALVNEAFMRLMGGNGRNDFVNRKEFFAAAAKAMYRILIDSARSRNRQKRGGGARIERLYDEPAVFDHDPAEMLAIDEVLQRLKRHDPRKAEVVKLRFSAGLTIDETAHAMDLSPRTVDSEWSFAKAWLHRELSKGDTSTGQENE